MSSRAWNNYDNWLLKGSGVDEHEIETFETEKHNLFSADEDNVSKFDEAISKIKLDHKDFNLKDYDNFEEFLDEFIQEYADEYDLDNNSYDAEMRVCQEQEDRRQEAIEYRAEQKMQARKDGDY